MNHSLEDVYRIVAHHESEPDRIVFVNAILFIGDRQLVDYSKGSGLRKLQEYVDGLEDRGLYPDAIRFMIWPTARTKARNFNTFTQAGEHNVFDVVFTEGYEPPPYVASLSGVRRSGAMGHVGGERAPSFDGATLEGIRRQAVAEAEARFDAKFQKYKLEQEIEKRKELERKLEELTERQQTGLESLAGIAKVLGQLAPLVPLLAGSRSPISQEKASLISDLAGAVSSEPAPSASKPTKPTFQGYEPDDFDDGDDQPDDYNPNPYEYDDDDDEQES